MDAVLASPAGKGSSGPEALTLNKALQILWDCAWEAVVLTFLVRLLGGVVVGVLGGIWHEMAPTWPPGVGAAPLQMTQAASRVVTGFFTHHSFGLLFGCFFVAKSVARLSRYGRAEEPTGAEAAVRRICHRLSEEWFSLVVVNAFTAFVAVMVLQFTQQFSTTHWVWGILCDAAQPLLQAGQNSFPVLFAKLSALFNWFGANQLKFTFWLFYAAAIGDDLGLPNYKALARFLWRRFRRRLHDSGQ